MNASDILDREFLQIRAKILELAASLDRLQRSTGNVENDPRIKTLHQGIETLLRSDGNRAEQIQLIGSHPYDAKWYEQYQKEQNV